MIRREYDTLVPVPGSWPREYVSRQDVFRGKLSQLKAIKGLGWSYHEARAIQRAIQVPYFWRTHWHLLVPEVLNG